ncbi:MAG: hypothetical protein KIT14_10335 [bacterium]|nr:hypothetical protein [bacterium]
MPRRRRRFLVALLLLAALAAPHARAADLPSPPLPDCAANGLVPNNLTDCEGTLASYHDPAAVPRPGPNGIALAISKRDVDFRRDEDLPGPAQTITFSYTTPGLLSGPGPDGGTYYATARLDWPAMMIDFNGARVSCRQAISPIWGGGCDGAPTADVPSPDFALLVRQGDCGPTATACTYRVTWGPYDRRVRAPMIFRLRFDWSFRFVLQKSDGTFDGSCGADPIEGCGIGGGISIVTFATTPPAPLHAIGRVRRVGAKAIELDATGSFPLVEHVAWSFQYPVVGEPTNRIERSTDPVFSFDFGEIDGIPASFFQGTAFATLAVTDHWNRTAFDSVPISFAEPAGTEGPLQMASFTLVDVDEDGRATLVAVVKNTTSNPIENVFVIGTDATGLVSPSSTPQGITLAGDASATFTVTVDFDTRPELTIRARAFGTTDDGPVKSAPKSQRFGRDGTAAGDTTVSQASQPGDTVLHVASNDGFGPGDYVLINPTGPNAEARKVEALGSLVFTTPLVYAHAPGEPVQTFVNDLDTDGPTIDVTSPVAGSVVCQGATVQATFTCSDGFAGVQTCGSPVTSGQTLDTNVVGPRLTTLRAWDIVGNVTETTVSWTVVSASASGGCTVPTTTTTQPGAVTTTTTLPGATTTTTLPPAACAGARECLAAVQSRALCEPPVPSKLQRFIDRKVRAALAKLGKAASASKETKATKLASQAGKVLQAIVKKAGAFAAKKKGGIPAACRDAIAGALQPAQQRLGEHRL